MKYCNSSIIQFYLSVSATFCLRIKKNLSVNYFALTFWTKESVVVAVVGMDSQSICLRFIWDQLKPNDFAQFIDDGDDDNDDLFIFNFCLLGSKFKRRWRYALRSNKLTCQPNTTDCWYDHWTTILYIKTKMHAPQMNANQIRWSHSMCLCTCVCVKSRSFAYIPTYWDTYGIDFGHTKRCTRWTYQPYIAHIQYMVSRCTTVKLLCGDVYIVCPQHKQ